MKKIILTLLILFSTLQAYGFEDYIIMSDKPVEKVYSKNETIASVVPFYTIDNKKNIMILKSKSEGNTEIVIESYGDIINITIDVNENETLFSEHDGITTFTLDFLDGPILPVLREGK